MIILIILIIIMLIISTIIGREGENGMLSVHLQQGDIYSNAGGSGGSYVYGFCDKNWRPGMTADDCLRFVRTAISLAMARDGSSGGCIRTVTISAEGVKRDFVANNQASAFPEGYGKLWD